MALFPNCNFRILVRDGVLVPGTRAECTLELEVPADIPRAEHIQLFFRSHAWVGYGSGKNRSVYRRQLYLVPMSVELPKDQPLQRGTYRYPFAIDVPAWLPPNYQGRDCAIEHVIEARLDVDWAVDPTATFSPVVVARQSEELQQSLTFRSPAGTHGEIVLDVALASNVRTPDAPFTGSIALRGGHKARFDFVYLTLQSVATLVMGRGDRRDGVALGIRIPADRMRHGDAVPFVFPPSIATPAVGPPSAGPPNENLPPTFRNGFIDHDLVLRVTVEIPWAPDPAFEVPLKSVARGSIVHGAASVQPVGGERLRQISLAMAQATGLQPGNAPTFVFGNVGPAQLHVDDGPRDGRLGIDVDIRFPDVDLGITFRQLSMLEGFRQSPLLPAPLDQRYLLRTEGTPIPEEALRAFFETVLRDLQTATDVQLGDHHLRLHFPLANDGTDHMVEVARFAQGRAKTIVDAIAALPFPIEAARAAWQATAAEQSAVLVPSGPSLFGLVVRSRILGGEERALGIAIRTVWKDGVPFTRVDVDLSNAMLSKDALLEIENEGPRLAAVRAVFPSIAVVAPARLALEPPTFADDPRTLFPGLEALLFWVLETRGERRADQPYR
jgi:hypothetical protein